jgi:membrane protease YdiL (CAAX protease family)
MLKRHRMISFFALAYLLSWYPWFIAMARGTHTGPNPLGPLVAALIVTALTEGGSGIKTLLARLIRVRVGIQWYAVVFLLPVAICAAAVGVVTLFGVPVPKISQMNKLPEILDRFIFIFLFIGLGEEPGWRGFALEHLQEKNSALRSSLLLAPLWAIWHLPLMGSEFPLHIVPAFLLSIFPGTILQTWIYNRTNGSVFLQMLFHTTVNTVGAGLLFPLFSGKNLTMLWYVYSLIWIAVALLVLSWKGIERIRMEAAPSRLSPVLKFAANSDRKRPADVF